MSSCDFRDLPSAPEALRLRLLLPTSTIYSRLNCAIFRVEVQTGVMHKALLALKLRWFVAINIGAIFWMSARQSLANSWKLAISGKTCNEMLFSPFRGMNVHWIFKLECRYARDELDLLTGIRRHSATVLGQQFSSLTDFSRPCKIIILTNSSTQVCKSFRGSELVDKRREANCLPSQADDDTVCV